jgi:ABC-type Fe3+ transport system substrate-binding protein
MILDRCVRDAQRSDLTQNLRCSLRLYARAALVGVTMLAFTGTASTVAAMTMDSPEWKNLVAAARAEGQLSVAASSSRDFDPVYEHFSKKFGIRMVISYGGGSEHADRILAERRGGIYAVDVGHVGANTVNRRLIPAGAVAPFEPYLLLNEVKNPSNWYGDRLWFIDAQQKYAFAHSADFERTFDLFINTKLVKESDLAALKTPHDLLSEKWRKKVVALSPMMGQSGNSYFRYSLLPGFGLEWMEKLVKSPNIDFVSNSRLIEDGLAGGKYAIAIFAIAAPLDKMEGLGLPVKRVDHLFEGTAGTMTAGSTAQTIHVYDRAPHPNAVKVFVNWLLSREGQTFIHDNLRNPPNPRNSIRKDVPRTNVPPQTVPQEGRKYHPIDLLPEYQLQRVEIMKKVQGWYKEAHK